MNFGSQPAIEAIAVRQLASISKGAADAGNMVANNIESVINRKVKSTDETPLLRDRWRPASIGPLSQESSLAGGRVDCLLPGHYRNNWRRRAEDALRGSSV